MNAQQAENLRILIRHMENNVTRTLNMDNYYEPCGTPACALGEAQVMGLVRNGLLWEHDCGPTFGLCSELSDRLFGIGRHNVWKRSSVTPKEWADEARKVLAAHGYAMDEPKVDPFTAFKVRMLEPVALTETV